MCITEGRVNRQIVIYRPLPDFIMANSVSSCFTAVQQFIWSLLQHQPEEANVRKLWYDDDCDDGKVILWFRSGVDK